MRKWEKYRNHIDENIQLLRLNPFIGHDRQDIPKFCLAWPIENHVLIYFFENNCVYLLRILHSKMNFLEQF